MHIHVGPGGLREVSDGRTRSIAIGGGNPMAVTFPGRCISRCSNA